MPCRILASGFRLAFALAAVAALLLIPAWLAVQVFGVALIEGWPPMLWHAHEMLYGFVVAAIAGFMLTAVPSWTRRRGFGGAPLVLLGALWLAARVLNTHAAAWPATLVAVLDSAFLLVLVVLFAPPLLRERNRNSPLLLVLLALVACNLLFHYALARRDPPAAEQVLRIAIDIVALLVTMVAGRIVPAYTATALRTAGRAARVRTRGVLGGAAIAAMIAVVLVDVFLPGGRVAAALAALAALLQALRLLQWQGWHALHEPLVWVLQAAYAWLPIGLALKCAALVWGPAASAFWLHALTVGAMAMMILGVMSRTTLSHTGRPMRVGTLSMAAYVLLLLAALTRVFGLIVPGLDYVAVLVLSGTCWSAAFALFLLEYGPMLWRPRADGRAG
ncbi:MAG: NnrS family protein [Gammaproteobacteria bacterium]|nr:NnrS family protein [Gammaproteobacteria bacterium]